MAAHARDESLDRWFFEGGQIRPTRTGASIDVEGGRWETAGFPPPRGGPYLDRKEVSGVTEDGSSLLPRSYGGLQALQAEFMAYQRAVFPAREPRFFALELCGEAGELANLEKKEWRGTVSEDADYADEAADVLIAVLNYANERGIDLAEAVSEKMAEIDRRRLENPGR